MNKLLIIDGNAIVHRAFHAYPPQLSTPEGKPINAVYGFFAMLIKVLEEVKPDYLAVCFDRPAPTFRKALYAGYQSSRPKMADGLSEQMVMLHEGLQSIEVPLFEIDGYEADDVIGTLSVQAKEQGVTSVILSADRDLLQLVNDRVSMFAPVIGITKFIFFDEATVLEKYGVLPSQVTDYKSLVGDNSDGYPGISGIGPKTAINLITKYGSLESLYEHIGELPEKIAQKLATDAEQAALAKKLATIVLDAPVHLRLDACDINNFTREKVLAVFDKLGFNSIKKRVNFFRENLIVESPQKKIKKNENQLELI